MGVHSDFEIVYSTHKGKPKLIGKIMKLVYLALIPCIISNTKASDRNELSKQQRDGKVFSLFSIVTFKNQGCRSQSGTVGSSGGNRNGTCYTSTECSSKGGTASGNCAAGFGVCCLFIYNSASTSVSENCSYIQNPNFPSAYGSTSTISWTVTKCAPSVCSIRFDFETFTTAGPTDSIDTAGCSDNLVFTASPSGFTTPELCGENAGQHVYVDIGLPSTASVKLEFTFSTTVTTISRSWEIKVTQIECSSTSKPYDSGCLQYFTGTTGRLTSFNFAQSSSSLYAHLASQNQNICIRQEAGFCCITYNVCSDTGSYTIENNADADSVIGTSCSSDFIEIPASTYSCGATQALNDRYCGQIFSVSDGAKETSDTTVVCSCQSPFTVQFITNAATAEGTTTTANRGFCLEYKQVGCDSSI